MLFSLNIQLHIKHSVHSQTENERLHKSYRPTLNAKMVTLYKSFVQVLTKLMFATVAETTLMPTGVSLMLECFEYC